MKLKELPPGLEVENAVIKSVSITNADHGCLVAWLRIDFNGGSCGFGGYKIGNADGDNLTTGDKNFAAHFLVRCLNTVGATEWENLAGKPLRVAHEGLGGVVVAIGNYIKDEWYCPRIEMKK